MLAPRDLPPEYHAWNRRWHAPDGRSIRVIERVTGRSRERLAWSHPRWVGPFAFQLNSSTRRFEYPWAFHAVEAKPGTRVVEIGGSLSGFQFVLARSGAHVVNVDPGEAASGLGWPVDATSIARLNRAFRTDVRLVNTTLEEAELPDESADLLYSISTIEHIPVAELPGLMREAQRILRPGGSFVLTVDLFLDLHPFTDATHNKYGTNVSVRDLVADSGLELVFGDTRQLYGFAEFDLDEVRANLSNLLVGGYPVLAQCLVLRK